MRTLLTYVLAALAVTLAAWIPLMAIAIAVLGHYADGVDAGVVLASVGQTWWLAAVAFSASIFIVSPSWILWQRIFARFHRSIGRGFHVLSGLLLGVGLGVIALALRAAFWFRDFSANPFGEARFYLIVAAITGAIWGTVFWLREPKTTQAMEAAA